MVLVITVTVDHRGIHWECLYSLSPEFKGSCNKLWLVQLMGGKKEKKNRRSRLRHPCACVCSSYGIKKKRFFFLFFFLCCICLNHWKAVWDSRVRFDSSTVLPKYLYLSFHGEETSSLCLGWGSLHRTTLDQRHSNHRFGAVAVTLPCVCVCVSPCIRVCTQPL